MTRQVLITGLSATLQALPPHLGAAPVPAATLAAVGQALQVSQGPNAIGPFAQRAANLSYSDERLPSDPRDLVRTGPWGQHLFDTAKDRGRSPHRRLQDTLFDGMMRDPDVKRRLIALMELASDVAPAEVPRYLRQYFPPGTIAIDGLLGLLLRTGTAAWMPKGLVRWGMQGALRDMGRRFLAGSNAHEAVETALDLGRDGDYITLDVVTEMVTSPPQVRRYIDRVLEVMRVWATAYSGPKLTPGGVPVLHVSVKPSALTHRFDPLAERTVIEDIGGALYELACEAKRLGFLLNVDSEHRQVRDMTYRAMGHVLRDSRLRGWGDIGFVVQAALDDAEAVMLQLLALADRLDIAPQIRVVKFAYHLYEQIVAARNGWRVPVYLSPGETDACFLRLVRLGLLNNGRCRIATGTHGIDDIAAVQEMREVLGIPPWMVENQVLRGVGDHLVADLGLPRRFYGPFGNEAEARGYEVRRLDEVDRTSAIGQTHASGEWPGYLEAREARRTQVAVPVGIPPAQFHNEPAPNFADRATHRAMRRAIRTVARRVRKYPPIVRPMVGVRVWGGDASAPLYSRNPATGELLATIYPATSDEVELAVFARNGRSKLERLGREGIIERLRKAAMITRAMKYTLAAMMILERGKTWPEAIGDVDEAIDMLEYYARTTAENTRQVTAEGRRPLGAGAAIAPFNYFAIAMGETAGLLAEGNVAILKPAEQTSWTDSQVVRILRQAGFPPDTVHFVPGPGETVGAQLVAHADINTVVFTGSKPVADTIIRTAATHPPREGGTKVVVAETGGKNPVVVMDDADVDLAVMGTLLGAFGMAGQRCSAISRVLVQRGIAEKYGDRLIEGARALVVGDPRDPITQIGPLIDMTALQKFLGYVEVARSEGTELLGSKDFTLPQGGAFAAPHIFLVTDPQARIWREEIFGPLLAVMVFDTFEQAMALANDADYGLTAAIFTRDLELAALFLRQIHAGRAAVNESPVAAPVGVKPFGGAKGSGTGPKAGGPNYTIHFTRPGQRPEAVDPIRNPASPSAPRDPLTPEVLGALREAQRAWAARPSESHLALAHTLAEQFRIAAQFLPHAERWLVPHTTVDVPGSINLEAFNWPVGVGLINTDGEATGDVLAATIAAIVMGNGVVLPLSKWSRFLRQELMKRGVPGALIVLVDTPVEDLVGIPDLDFLVAHGPRAAALANTFLANPPRTDLFRRAIGVHEAPTDAHYLTRFANARTWSELTFRNGADLNFTRRYQTARPSS